MNGGHSPEQLNGDHSSSLTTDGYANAAPTFEVPERKIIAIEHPCLLRNLDDGLKSFGAVPNFTRLVDPTEQARSIPLWLRPDTPTSKPIISHPASTNNVLLKIIVPKRTGRKRKRGSNGPFSGPTDNPDVATEGSSGTVEVDSFGRRDTPKSILRKLQDNAQDYEVEAVGTIRASHRYRGLADFQFSHSDSPFLTKVTEHLLPLKVSKLREFKFNEGVATAPGQEIIPPPHFSDRNLAFNYSYEQNPAIQEQGLDEAGETRIVNTMGRKMLSYGHFISHLKYPVPEKPQKSQVSGMQVPGDLLHQLEEALERRPIWTRRALLNQVHGNYAGSLLKIAIQLVGYQFRGGPWRDAIVKYGVDPRSDPKYRIYQTLSFKAQQNKVGLANVPWETIRKDQAQTKDPNGNRSSHIWNGESFSMDGKFWQVCDITDPFLVRLIEKAPLRTECDLNDTGWYHSGTWVKIKTVMKAKMIAITKGRMGSDDDDPPKKGFLYNSFIATRLQIHSDTNDSRVNISLEAVLRPIIDLEGNNLRRRTLLTSAKKRRVTSATPSSLGGGEESEDSLAGTGEEAHEQAALLDDAWAHVLDSDLDDVEIEGEEDDNVAQEKEDGVEGEDEDIEQEYDNDASDGDDLEEKLEDEDDDEEDEDDAD